MVHCEAERGESYRQYVALAERVVERWLDQTSEEELFDDGRDENDTDEESCVTEAEKSLGSTKADGTVQAVKEDKEYSSSSTHEEIPGETVADKRELFESFPFDEDDDNCCGDGVSHHADEHSCLLTVERYEER